MKGDMGAGQAKIKRPNKSIRAMLDAREAHAHLIGEMFGVVTLSKITDDVPGDLAEPMPTGDERRLGRKAEAKRRGRYEY